MISSQTEKTSEHFAHSLQAASGSHRIDAEIVGDTLLFYLGWVSGGYGHRENSYGMSFEKAFTGPLAEGTIAHRRVISYTFGGLKTLVKYQVDACINTMASDPVPTTFAPMLISPSGLQIMEHGTMIPLEHVIEIKTLGEGYRPMIPRTMAQLWFSHTPVIMAGYHDGRGRFSSVEKIDVMESGQAKPAIHGRFITRPPFKRSYASLK